MADHQAPINQRPLEERDLLYLNKDGQLSGPGLANAILLLLEKADNLVAAVDRNTAAIYDTAKPQPLNDQFLEQVQKAADFLRFITSDEGKAATGKTNKVNPSWTTAKSLANKLETHIAEIRRAK